MNMRALKDLLDNNLFKLIFILAFLLIIIFIFIFTSVTSKHYYATLFYPDKSKTSLLYEKRLVVKSGDREERISNLVEELLLGPIDREKFYFKIFPGTAKLEAVWIEGETVYLNFNKDLLNRTPADENDNISIYYILLQSVVNTICFEDRQIKRVKFYFNGKSYSYISGLKLVDGSMEPDRALLK